MKKRVFLLYASLLVILFLGLSPTTVHGEHSTTVPVTGHIGFVKDYVNVEYHSNGGDGGVVVRDILVESSHTILSGDEAKVQRVNHQFARWNTKPDGSGEVIIPGETMMLQEHIVLYAQWGVLKSSGLSGSNDPLAVLKSDVLSSQLLPRTGEQVRAPLALMVGVLVLVGVLYGYCRKKLL